jgi:hypothetical protein
MSGTFVALLLLLALAGCGQPGPATGSPSGAPSDTGSSRQPSAAASAVDPTAQVGPQPTTGVFVEYGRQGGIAGVNDRLTIQADGTFEISRGGRVPVRGKLSPAELAALRQVLDASHFERIPSVNPAPRGSADIFTYFVGYGDHQVLAQDGAVPPALAPVISALDTIAAR